MALNDAWRRLRNVLLRDQAFQRWSAATPGVRSLARRSAAELFDLCAGFVYSQVLLACVDLRLLDRLADAPQEEAALARALDLPEASTQSLLRAAAALDLVESAGPGRWGLGRLGAALLGAPGVAAMVEHHALVYRDLADPVALLRRGGPAPDGGLARFWSYARAQDPSGTSADAAREYSRLMAASQPMVAAEAFSTGVLARARTVLDVGGGEAAFALAAAKRFARPRFVVFDLPAVAALARAAVVASPYADRIDVVGGDAFTGAWPAGADVVTFVRVLHDHDDDRAAGLLERARSAIAPGGTVLVVEPMAEAPAARRMGGAYFGLYLLAMGSGRPRTPKETADLLVRAGFDRVRRHAARLPLAAQAITARARPHRFASGRKIVNPN